MHMRVASTNFAKTLVCKRENDVILLRHKHRISNNKVTIRHCLILEFRRRASNQAVAPGITTPLHGTDLSNEYVSKYSNQIFPFSKQMKGI